MLEGSNFWEGEATVDAYFSRVDISTEDVHYAYNFPGERELGLLGLVEGKRVIEIGCGRGENSIALAKMGAKACGIDMSEEMLARARENAEQNGVEIDLLHLRAEKLASLNQQFDVAISVYVFDYVENLKVIFEGVADILVSKGVFVFSFCHPIQKPDSALRTETGSFYIEGEWPETGMVIRNFFHPTTLVEEELKEAGFSIDRVVEAKTAADISPEELKSFPYRVSLMPGFKEIDIVPHTIIFRAVKD